MSTPLRVAF